MIRSNTSRLHFVFCCVALVVLACGLVSVAAGQTRAGPQGKAATVDAVAKTISQALPSAGLREFVMCQVRPALWAGYNLEVFVDGSETVDRVSRVFKIVKGSFSAKTDPRSSGAIVEVERSGLAILKSNEKAFAKGAPFFIGDVSIEPPDTVRYTVFSNPAVPTSEAMARRQTVRKGESGYGSSAEVVESTAPFNSAPAPMTRTFKGNFDEQSVLSIVTYIEGRNRCLVSNEVPLAPFLPGAKLGP